MFVFSSITLQSSVVIYDTIQRNYKTTTVTTICFSDMSHCFILSFQNIVSVCVANDDLYLCTIYVLVNNKYRTHLRTSNTGNLTKWSFSSHSIYRVRVRVGVEGGFAHNITPCHKSTAPVAFVAACDLGRYACPDITTLPVVPQFFSL